MNVLSLFDGMSCGQQALKELGINYDNYYASEIDQYAIEIAKKNFPNTIHVGDVKNLKGDTLPQIDLLMGGSPCQGFSFAGRGLNFDDPRSALFFEFVRLLKETNPKYFLLENVRMKQQHQDVITDHLGVRPININSSLLSAQNRVRLYWTNIPNIQQPNDLGLVLSDILEDCVEEKYFVGEKLQSKHKGGDQLNSDYKSQANTIHEKETKSPTVCAGTHGYANGYIEVETLPSTLPLWLELSHNGKKRLERVREPHQKARALTATMHKGHVEHLVKGYETEKYWQVDTSGKGWRSQSDRFRKINYPSNTLAASGASVPRIVLSQRERGMSKGIVRDMDEKSPTLTSSSWEHNNHIVYGIKYRKLTPIECERLQTLPDNYTEGVPNTQRYKMIGNGWTISVIKHILNEMI